jgi:hypothetical protein
VSTSRRPFGLARVTHARRWAVVAWVLWGLLLLPGEPAEGGAAWSRHHIVVLQTGWTYSIFGHSLGVVLRNRSRTHDALSVMVIANEMTRNGPDTLGFRLAVIPAGHTVYLAAQDASLGRVRGVQVSVRVRFEVARRFRLPSVAHVRVDRAAGKIRATMTNTHSTTFSIYSTANAVLFDKRGEVIGGAAMCSLQVGNVFPGPDEVMPWARANVECTIPEVVAVSRIASAGVTVFGR